MRKARGKETRRREHDTKRAGGSRGGRRVRQSWARRYPVSDRAVEGSARREMARAAERYSVASTLTTLNTPMQVPVD